MVASVEAMSLSMDPTRPTMVRCLCGAACSAVIWPESCHCSVVDGLSQSVGFVLRHVTQHRFFENGLGGTKRRIEEKEGKKQGKRRTAADEFIDQAAPFSTEDVCSGK